MKTVFALFHRGRIKAICVTQERARQEAQDHLDKMVADINSYAYRRKDTPLQTIHAWDCHRADNGRWAWTAKVTWDYESEYYEVLEVDVLS